MITDSPQKFADDILQLMNKENLWKTISENSRKLAQDIYTWEAVFEKVIEAIEKK